MNGIQCFHDCCLQLNTDFSNSVFGQTPTSMQGIVAQERFCQRQKWAVCVLIKITYFCFSYSVFTSSYELFSQALKSFDYVISGNERKIA